MTKIARSPRSKRRELENWFYFSRKLFSQGRVSLVSKEKKSGCCFYAGWFGDGPVSDDSIDPRHTTVNSRCSFVLFAVCLRHSGLSGLIRYRITYVRCERRKSIEEDANICHSIFIVLDARRDEVFFFVRFLRKVFHAQVCFEGLSGIVTEKKEGEKGIERKNLVDFRCAVFPFYSKFFPSFFSGSVDQSFESISSVEIQ